MNKIIIITIAVMMILGVYLSKCLFKTKQISEPEQSILSDDFKNQPIDDPVYHPEYVHEFDGELGL